MKRWKMWIRRKYYYFLFLLFHGIKSENSAVVAVERTVYSGRLEIDNNAIELMNGGDSQEWRSNLIVATDNV